MVPIRSSLSRRFRLAGVTIGIAVACTNLSPIAGADEAKLSPAETRAMQERFEKHQAAIRSASVGFTQILSLAGLRNPAVSQGRILYAAPERLRIEYQRPAGELVLLPGDGTLVTRKPGRPDTSRAIDRLDERTRRSVSLLLSLFEGKLPAGFPVAKIEARRTSGNRVIVTMYRESTSPTATSDGFDKVDTTLALPGLDPVAVSIRLAGTSEIRYEFGPIERNVSLPSDAFAPPTQP